ncbi:hypothetical protein H5410_057581 [Solanum commersonii]|uniref:Uncharacterized protein n=1 Tax=Solanum commersonii TaxID=4109 RepID=A0A9J5WQG0_SOLCO|nr:hypothetical protein H5410_057581 [Solanum commersonii]
MAYMRNLPRYRLKIRGNHSHFCVFQQISADIASAVRNRVCQVMNKFRSSFSSLKPAAHLPWQHGVSHILYVIGFIAAALPYVRLLNKVMVSFTYWDYIRAFNKVLCYNNERHKHTWFIKVCAQDIC